MNNTTKNIVFIVIALVVILVAVFSLQKAGAPDPKMDEFASCLKDRGATFYGAFWCPHCKEQKRTLGNSKNIPYVECSSPDGQSVLPICAEKGVESFPTWIFADGSELTGETPLSVLSEKTGCALPQ